MPGVEPTCCCCSLTLVSALVLLCRPWSADSQNLEEPKNVQIHYVDQRSTVKWEWPTKSSADDSNVTFSVSYQRCGRKKGKWKKLFGCQNVAVTKCDFSTQLDYNDKYNICVQAERGNTTSPWSKAVDFVPHEIAQFGPPSAVQIEFIEDFFNINISAPRDFNIPIFDEADFKYNLHIWSNNSSEQPKQMTVCAIDTIDGLALNTTYCLKVKAFIVGDLKKGPFSPVFCRKTSQTALKPRPENLRVHAINTEYVLKWDWKYSFDKNVSFTVEYQRKQCLSYRHNKYIWKIVSACQDIITTECDMSLDLDFYEPLYFIRVRASSEEGPPIWSKKIKFSPRVENEIGPPSHIKVTFSNGLLQIQMAPPQGPKNQSMAADYNLSYNVLIWKNSSELEKMNKSGNVTFYIFSDLEPLTVYCLKVQAQDKESGKVGHFSAVQCVETAAGNSPFWLLLIFVVSAVVAFFTVVFLWFSLNYLKRWISYVFFPSCKLPSNIKECLQEQHMNKAFLVHVEEHTDPCSVTQNIVVEAIDQTDENHESKHSKQRSRDSGNYSNEDDTEGALGMMASTVD